MLAARTGNVDAVKLLAAPGNVNAAERRTGTTALMWAALDNRADAVRALAAAGASLNARSTVTDYPHTPPGVIGDKVEEGASYVGQTVLPKGGWTALMYASRQGAARGGDGARGCRRRSRRGRSRRQLGADVRHHQRPLRRRDAAGGKGRERQPGGPHRRDAAVLRGRHAHDADLVRAARADPDGDRGQRRRRQDAARPRRRPERAAQRPDPEAAVQRRRSAAGRRGDAVHARGARRRCRS